LGKTLNQATSDYLANAKSPSRVVNELDNRGSHFFLAMYWAQAMAAQEENAALQKMFAPLAQQLAANEETILAELLAAQGEPVDIGGYYQPDVEKTSQAMRPSATLNGILDAVA
jgi:isocitrate dehydrogenase